MLTGLGAGENIHLTIGEKVAHGWQARHAGRERARGGKAARESGGHRRIPYASPHMHAKATYAKVTYDGAAA